MYNMHTELNNDLPRTYPVNVKRLILIPTKKTYQDVAIRSFSLDCNQYNMDNLSNMISSHLIRNNGQGYIAGSDIRTNVPELLKLNKIPGTIADIPNGWNTQRLRFLMETETIQGSIVIKSYFQGYSEYYDVSMSGLVDPNMRFYVNSLVSVKYWMDPATGYSKPAIYQAYNLLTDTASENAQMGLFNSATTLIRPIDVLDNLTLESRYGGEYGRITTTHNLLSSTAFHTSKRSNSNPMQYLAGSIDSIINTASDPDLNIGIDTANITDKARNFVQEAQIDTCPLLTEVGRLTGEIAPKYFTLNLLEAINPGLSKSNVITLVRDNPLVAPNYLTNLDSDITHEVVQPLDSNVKANAIATSLPSMMLEYYITEITLTISNLSGQPMIGILHANSFIEGIDLIPHLEVLKRKILDQLYPVISNQNMSALELQVECDLLGDINISINIDQTGHMLYRYPAFADSLYQPVLTTQSGSDMFKNDYQNFTDVTIETVRNVASNGYNVRTVNEFAGVF